MKMRLHPSIILEKLFSSLIFVLAIGYYIIIEMLGDFSKENLNEAGEFLTSLGLGTVMISFIVILFVLIVFALVFTIIWKNTYVYFEKNSLIIERGKLFKKVTTIHLKDIASVNIRRNILEKILGTSNIKIDLNTSNGEIYNGKLVFSEKDATEIKNKLLKQNTKKEPIDNDEFESDIKYDSADVFKHMLLSIDTISIIVILIVYFAVIITITATHNGINSIILTTILLIFLFAPLTISLIKTYLSYYNFKCTRIKNNIKLSYGALTTYKYSIPINRINAIIIHQTLQARILGYYAIEVVNAGIGGEDKNEKTVISLYVKEDIKNKILKEILPEFKNNIKANKAEESSLKHYLLSKLFIMILSIVLAPFTYCLTLLMIPILLIMAFGQYKTRKIGSNSKMIIITNGILNKRTIIIKYDNIELMAKEQKLFSFVYKTEKLRVQIIGPSENSVFISGLFDENIINKMIKAY